MIESMMPQPSAQFIDDVKIALEHLYDIAFLQKLDLAQWLNQAQLADSHRQSTQTLGHHLRRELIEAIEALSSPSRARYYQFYARHAPVPFAAAAVRRRV